MIELHDFSIGFKSHALIEDVNVVFGQGCLTALIGRNGAGKSTLLRAIAGLGKNFSGSICIDGKNVSDISYKEIATSLAFVTTERIRIPNLKCRDIVGMGRAPYTDWIGHLREEDKGIVECSLRQCGMSDFAERTMDSMSDGECQRIMIARALAQDTPNILLDEPTSFLDLPSRYQLVELLSELAHCQNKTIIFSTHELDIALSSCDNVALISDRKIYDMSAADMAASGLIESKFDISLNKRVIISN